MTIDQELHRILLIDSYDSFTYNLASLCRQSIPNSRIHIIKNDQFTLPGLLPHLDCFAAVIVGPGPGSPDDPDAVGIIKDLWKVADEKLLPIFGVCLGLQSLGIEFGATLKRLNVVKHGQVSHIHHTGAEIFKGVGDVDAVRYHSLHVELAPGGDIEQLGWSDDGKENGAVVMALKHKTKPFWAVQYHPESACTEGGGEDVIANFWRLAKNWARANERTPLPWDTAAQIAIGPSWPQLGGRQPGVTSPTIARQITTTVLNIYDVTTATICEYLGVSKESTPFVLLDSAAQPGRFTIIGALTPSSPKITYYTKDSFVTVTEGSTPTHRALGTHDIWSWLAAFMRKRKAQGGTAEIPFWGGLVGYLSYELGVEGLSVPSRPEGLQPDTHPDVNLVFVERSIVRDSVTGKTYLQTIIPDDDAWLASTAADLTTLHPPPADADRGPSSTKKPRGTARPKVILPDKSSYISRIKTAKEHLFAGDSYELCVTAPTRIIRDIPSSPSPSWDLYQTLRLKNPAPYSAYLRLHPSTLVASSPERFLSYSRGPGTVCQLRPIKGTLRKGPGVTRAVAETALAGNRKEVAENLMIVDLIRHDLHGVVGEDVQVKKFCGVEESETVWSLVSVIEGRLPAAAAAGAPGLDADGELGWEVLSRSLPPGSMTGAPKKRSVEILQTLGDCNRSLYSGVFGYWCVGGSGDWSVVIRSCFKYDDQFNDHSSSPSAPSTSNAKNKDKEEWTIGAGGAITALSDPEAEWDEMVVKLQSVLRAFGASDS